MSAPHRSDAPDTDAVPICRRPAGVVATVKMWWDGAGEIEQLTRDVEREQRILAEAAVQLVPGPWAIANLFKQRR